MAWLMAHRIIIMVALAFVLLVLAAWLVERGK